MTRKVLIRFALQRAVAGSRARGGTRTRKPFGIRPSNVRVCQFHHPSVEREQTFRRRQPLASVEYILLTRARNS